MYWPYSVHGLVLALALARFMDKKTIMICKIEMFLEDECDGPS